MTISRRTTALSRSISWPPSKALSPALAEQAWNRWATLPDAERTKDGLAEEIRQTVLADDGKMTIAASKIEAARLLDVAVECRAVEKAGVGKALHYMPPVVR